MYLIKKIAVVIKIKRLSIVEAFCQRKFFVVLLCWECIIFYWCLFNSVLLLLLTTSLVDRYSVYGAFLITHVLAIHTQPKSYDASYLLNGYILSTVVFALFLVKSFNSRFNNIQKRKGNVHVHFLPTGEIRHFRTAKLNIWEDEENVCQEKAMLIFFFNHFIDPRLTWASLGMRCLSCWPLQHVNYYFIVMNWFWSQTC